MDIPDQNQATEIARAYLKQLSQHLGPTGEIQKPEVWAWLELEQRLMLQSPADTPKKVNQSSPRRTPAINKSPKKAQSIWKRPISDLWR
jgi:hypothetical protein